MVSVAGFYAPICAIRGVAGTESGALGTAGTAIEGWFPPLGVLAVPSGPVPKKTTFPMYL